MAYASQNLSCIVKALHNLAMRVDSVEKQTKPLELERPMPISNVTDGMYEALKNEMSILKSDMQKHNSTVGTFKDDIAKERGLLENVIMTKVEKIIKDRMDAFITESMDRIVERATNAIIPKVSGMVAEVRNQVNEQVQNLAASIPPPPPPVTSSQEPQPTTTTVKELKEIKNLQDLEKIDISEVAQDIIDLAMETSSIASTSDIEITTGKKKLMKRRV